MSKLAALILSPGGRVDGWVDCSRVIIKLNSVQLQLQLPAGTELGNKDDIISRNISKNLHLDIPSIFLALLGRIRKLCFLKLDIAWLASNLWNSLPLLQQVDLTVYTVSITVSKQTFHIFGSKKSLKHLHIFKGNHPMNK